MRPLFPFPVPTSFEGEGGVDQQDEQGHLNQRANYRRKGLPAAKPECGGGHSDGELEVVPRGGEGHRRHAGIVGAETVASQELAKNMMQKYAIKGMAILKMS
ncbi:MAG: hypothetical protein ACOYIK_07215 [Coriobacteriales bacterium]